MDAVIRGKQVYCGSRWPGSCTRVAVLVFKDRKVDRCYVVFKHDVGIA